MNVLKIFNWGSFSIASHPELVSLLSGKDISYIFYRTAGIEIGAIFQTKGFLRGYIATIKGLTEGNR